MTTQHLTTCPCGEGIGVTDDELETDFGRDALAEWLKTHEDHGTMTNSERII